MSRPGPRGRASGTGARAAPSRGRSPHGVRRWLRRLVSTDRIYVLWLLVLLLLLGAIASGPLGDYSAASARVDQLTAQRDALRDAVAEMDGARQDLEDPQVLELLAREELGLVRPGEIPYVIVDPSAPPQTPAPPSTTLAPPLDPPAVPWYRRLVERVLALF